jgi:hypothetical protein
MNSKSYVYTHKKLNQEVRAIGGHYALIKEERISVKGQSVLYLMGYAVFDTTCCGTGGCVYALVPGTVSRWKYDRNGSREAVSELEPIDDPKLKKEITRVLIKRESVLQVQFGPL